MYCLHTEKRNIALLTSFYHNYLLATHFFTDELQIILRHLNQTQFVHKHFKWSLIPYRHFLGLVLSSIKFFISSLTDILDRSVFLG